jgi:hypothetical protein
MGVVPPSHDAADVMQQTRYFAQLDGFIIMPQRFKYILNRIGYKQRVVFAVTHDVVVPHAVNGVKNLKNILIMKLPVRFHPYFAQEPH